MFQQNSVIESFSLHFASMPWWLVVLLILLSAGAAIWFYRDTVPPIHGFARGFLTSIRAVGLFLVLLGLAEPIISIIATVPTSSVTMVIFDTSSSMDAETDPVRIADAHTTFSTLQSRLPGEAVYMTFDTAVRRLEQHELSFTGNGTNIAAALSSAASNPDASDIILVSDGRWNLGEDPAVFAQSCDVPVHTITVGSDSVAYDVVITGISVSPVGRDGTEIPVEISVAASVPFDTSIPVTISENGLVITSDEIILRDVTSANIVLSVPLDGTGKHEFTASIESTNDINETNNYRDFNVNALKNHYSLLLAAAQPSSDLAFLRRVIDSDSSFTLDIAIGSGARGSFMQSIPADLTRYDGIILVDSGGTLLTGLVAASIRDRVSNGCGLWILGSMPPGPEGAVLEQALPLRFAGTTARTDSLFTITPTVAGHSHFVTAESADTGGAWSNLPPIYSIMPIDIRGRQATVLAEAIPSGDQSVRLPAIIAGTIGSGKFLGMPLSGIWRWSLTMSGAGRDTEFYTRFVTGALNWLTAETDTAPLTITTGAQSYLSGQAVHFEGRLYDNVYVPVTGAEITLEIDDNPANRTLLEETAPSVYTASKQGISPGTHSYRAIAYRDRTEFAAATGTFTVQEFSLEMLSQSADLSLMQSIAAHSGGIAVTPSGIDSVISNITPKSSFERHNSEHYPALNPLIPFSALILFSIEWAIRKRRGML